jgi:hypothetical protein
VNGEVNGTYDGLCRELVVDHDEEESCVMGNGGYETGKEGQRDL